MNVKTILVISPIPTHPRNAGHRERIYQLLRQMLAFGHDAHLLHITLEPGGDMEAMRSCWGDRLHLFQHNPLRTPNGCAPSFHATLVGRLLRRLGSFVKTPVDFPYGVDDWHDSECEKMIAELHRQFAFDVVCAEYLFCSKTLNLFDAPTLKILDTHDIFGNRRKLFQQHGQRPNWFYTTRREERKALRRADVIIAIQEHEQRFFQQLVPEREVVTVGHFVELCPLPFKAEGRPTLLFLASSNPVNLYGFNHFLRESWPIIQAQAPDVKLLVAGSLCQALPDHAAYAKLGAVNSAQDAYSCADIVISPILFGTGLKIKSVEALGCAKPLVTTPIGAEGLDAGMQTAFVAAPMPDEFANRIIELLTNSELRHVISQQAYRFAEKLHHQNCSVLYRILQFDPKTCLSR